MKILHIEDSQADAELVQSLLLDEWPDCIVQVIATPADLRQRLATDTYDVILSDFSLGSFDGLDALKVVRERTPETPFIFLSGTIGEDRAIEAVQAGAQDYVLKDRMKRLITAIHRALRESGERKQRRTAEQALQRFASILEMTPNFVGMAKTDGRIFYVNRAGLVMAGLPQDQDLGLLNIDQLHPPADRKRILEEAIPKAIRDGSWVGETTLLTNKGTSIPVSQIIIAHRATATEEAYLSTIMHDLSAYKEAERHIREQADLLNKARDAIVVTNLEGLITFWNEGAERICGWNAGEVLGREITSIFGEGTTEEITEIRRTLLTSDEWRGEIHLHNRNGDAVTMDLRTTQIRNAVGQPHARLSIGTDVTAKKKLEDQFLRSQRIESIGLLAAGIAHDLNNVLAPIMMASPMLRERATDPDDIRLLETLEKSAERGTGLVRQIMGFAHGTGGVHRMLQAKHLVRDIAAVIHETFPKTIRLEERVAFDLWAIRGNPTHVHQVLLNLCVNARDAMPAGGKLRLSAENRVLTEADAKKIVGASPGAYIMLEVADTGMGIPPTVLERIWEPFFTTKDIGKGTGLGLSTVRGIVENHQGFIRLETQPGAGSTFSVFFPAADMGGGKAEPDAPPIFAVRGNNELVLVVDDEQDIRVVTAATLAHYGYRVLVAGDGAEAVALFAQRGAEISIVVTDLSMPNLDGAALANIVRHMNPAVKILTVSGLSTAGRTAQNQKLSGDFLLKPFKAEALLQSVHHLLHPEERPL